LKKFLETYSSQWPGKIIEKHPLVILSALLFMSHFLLFRRFGIYEDDIDFIVKFYQIKPVVIWNDMVTCLTTWPQGRPLGFALPHLFAWAGSSIGGMMGIYLLSFILILLNVIILYRILRQISGESLFAFLGALTFIVYPADTTKIFLTHIQIQASQLFLLLAVAYYLKGNKVLSYVLITLTLLTYESLFIPFIIVPLLVVENKINRRFWRNLVIHGGILFLVVCLYLFLRLYVFRDTRIISEYDAESSKLQILANYLAMQVSGPILSFLLFVIRPVWGVLSSGILGIVVMLIAFFLIYSVGFHDNMNNPGVPAEVKQNRVLKTRLFHIEFVVDSKWLRILLAGIICVLTSYLFIINKFRPMPMGRSTSVHIAACLGWSLILPSVYYILRQLYERKQRLLLITALYFASLIGFNVSIQKDFSKVWEIKKAFWHDLFAINPRLAQNTWIFIIDLPPDEYDFFSKLHVNHYIKPFTFDMEVTPTYILRLPQSWNQKIGVSRFPDMDRFKIANNKMMWLPSIYGKAIPWQPVDSTHVILLKYENGKLKPHPSYTFSLGDSTFTINSSEPVHGTPISDFPKKPFAVELLKP